MQKKYLILFFLFICLSACVVGPDYRPPVAPSMNQFSQVPEDSEIQEEQLRTWWRAFNDPVLDDLITHALTDNHDMRIAAARILEARAGRAGIQAIRGPNITGKASATAVRLSETGVETANLPPEGVIPAYQFDPTLESYNLGIDATWEFDLFGRVTRAIEAADADLAVSRAELNAVAVSLVAEVAGTYVELRKIQQLYHLGQANLEILQQSENLIRERYESGLDTKFPLTRTQAQRAQVAADLPQLLAREQNLRHRLALLLGQTPEALNESLQFTAEIPQRQNPVAVGLPAELLRRRPDIQAAERRLAGQTARIGMATAELYPRFAINGSIGLATTDLGSLDVGKSWTGSLGPSIRWSLFDGGTVRAKIAAADARAQAALVQYEKTVIQAYGEVENALVNQRREEQRLSKLNQAREAEKEAYELSQELYEAGIVTYLDVLESHRRLYLTDLQITQAEAQISLNTIHLYKALGGGLPEQPKPETQTTQHQIRP